MLPDTATEAPNQSWLAGVGLISVATRAPVVALNTYADPGSGAPRSSPQAPTTTVLPDTATETPNAEPLPGVGLFRVATGARVAALNTYADPPFAGPW